MREGDGNRVLVAAILALLAGFLTLYAHPASHALKSRVEQDFAALTALALDADGAAQARPG